MLSSHRRYSVCRCYIAAATVAATGTSTVLSLANGKDAQKRIRDFPPCSTIWTERIPEHKSLLDSAVLDMQQEPYATGTVCRWCVT